MFLCDVVEKTAYDDGGIEEHAKRNVSRMRRGRPG